MVAEFLVGSWFLASTTSILFPDETEKLKKAIAKSIVLTREQMSASAKSTNSPSIKAYRTQEDTRRNRVKLEAGEIIYFPNGAQISVKAGLYDTQIDGWWYAWDANDKVPP